MMFLKKSLVVLLFAVMPVVAFAQSKAGEVIKKASHRDEIATQEATICGYTVQLEVFKLSDVGTYWLSVGNLGIGTDLIQLQFDPVYELFIPLGDSLDEALETLKDLQSMYKEPRLATKEVQGCLAAMYPNDSFEPVTVTSRRLLSSKILSFSVQRSDFVRSTYITKTQFGTLVFGAKLYKKLHPKEK